jgi:pilus assembly protein CpaB
VTVPLIQGVLVMATGQRSVSDPKSGELKTYTTVTLDTDPNQAQNIIVAREAGRITALLRNPQDKITGQGNQTDLAALLGAASLAGGSHDVPVLYGGRGAKLPAEGLTLGAHAPAPASAPASMQAPAPALPSALPALLAPPAQNAAGVFPSQSLQAPQ